jgi:hypothetical protein
LGELERAQHALKGFSQVSIWGNWRGRNRLSRAFDRLAFGGTGEGITHSQGLLTGWHLGELGRAQRALKGFQQVGIWGNWRGNNTLSRAFDRLAFGGTGEGATRFQRLSTGWYLGELERAQHAFKGFQQVGIWENWRGRNMLSRDFYRLAFGGTGDSATCSQRVFTGWNLRELERAQHALKGFVQVGI